MKVERVARKWLPGLFGAPPKCEPAPSNPNGTRQAIVITGASEGIGKAFAELLHGKGCTVLMIARDGIALDAVAASLTQSEEPSRAFTLALDIAEPNAADKVETFLTARNLCADVVINNAAIGLGGRFDSHSTADITNLLRVNVDAMVSMTHKFLPGMRARGHGGFLNLASLAGFVPGPWQALYFASKAFVLSFSQAVAAECQGSGVRIMAAAPGPVETRIHSAMKSRWSFYRRLFPSYEPAEMCEMLWDGFSTGRRVLVPGIVNNVSALGSRFMPNELLVPFVGWLVRPRLRSGKPMP